MRFVTPVALAALLMTACAPAASDSSQPAPAGGAVIVYAAASLQDAFEAIAAAYEEESGVEIILSFDASSALRTQIGEGAPADLFASADISNPQQLVDDGLIDGEPRIFASNALAIVVPADGTGGVDSWQGMAGPGVRVIAAGKDVPITGYATELVDNLAAQPDAPEGFAEAYEANIVSREDNVRAVLAKIEAGEGDVGVLYETDAASTEDVTAVTFPEDANVLAEYAFVTLADAGESTDAFADWLVGPDGQAILQEFGFRPPAT
jgi:molybdate transport system substrate-binding protein